MLIFDAITRLVYTFRDLPGVVVHDGPPGQRGSDRLELAVGWSPDDLGAESDRTETTYDYAEREAVSVTCLASAWHGDIGAAPLREALDGLVESLRTRLADDRSLGGLVTDARLGPRMVYDAALLDDGGTSASVAFTIDAIKE